MGEEHARHILPKFPQREEWREERVCSKWFNIHANKANREIITCKNVIKLETIGKYLLKTKCKSEIKVRGRGTTPLRLSGRKTVKCENELRVERVAVH
jgi:hypothetical protein